MGPLPKSPKLPKIAKIERPATLFQIGTCLPSLKQFKFATICESSYVFFAAFTDVPTAIEEIRAGRMIVVVDDEDRENEGDLTMAAEKITPEAINFMAKFGRGLICLAMTPERLDYLRIGPMTRENTSPYGTAFYESVEAREGVTTGISAHDRARTIQVAIDPASRAADLVRPGTSSLLLRAKAACWSVPDRRKPRSIWRAWPA